MPEEKDEEKTETNGNPGSRFNLLLGALISQTQHLASMNVKMDRLVEIGVSQAEGQRSCDALRETMRAVGALAPSAAQAAERAAAAATAAAEVARHVGTEGGKAQRVLYTITLFLVACVSILAGIKLIGPTDLLKYIVP